MKGFLVAVLLSAVISLGGCGATGMVSDGASPFANLAVQYVVYKGVGRYVDGDVDKADRVQAVAMEIVELIDSDTLTRVSLVEEAVRSRIDWQNLLPEDALLLDGLIDAISFELEAKLGDGELDPERQVGVRAVMGWAVQAATFAGAEMRGL